MIPLASLIWRASPKADVPQELSEAVLPDPSTADLRIFLTMHYSPNTRGRRTDIAGYRDSFLEKPLNPFRRIPANNVDYHLTQIVSRRVGIARRRKP